MMPTPSIALDAIARAMEVIDPVFLRTPQYVDPGLSEALGCEVLLKVETLNPIRCFKGRGACVYMASVEPGMRVVGASAGNFGQAIAWAGRERGIPVTIFAATTANARKLARIRALGAEVVQEGHDFDAAKEAARTFAASSAGVRFVEDAADLETVIGAGTIGLELASLPASRRPDVLLVPLGNGALINGIATWTKAHAPEMRIVGVVAEAAPSMEISWRTGVPTVTETAATMADGIGVRIPVASAVALTRELVDDIVTVSEVAIREGLVLARDAAGMLLEPSAVVGLVALLANPRLRAGRVGTVVTGANASDALVADLTGNA
ncbi:MAG TPA: pyridoxal-phosphate dependent enzyme [Thermomicrobiales bacterium]|nr:pyridoxal-phosphate dependent enzyme [Thermomicrobiales bacterium]